MYVCMTVQALTHEISSSKTSATFMVEVYFITMPHATLKSIFKVTILKYLARYCKSHTTEV